MIETVPGAIRPVPAPLRLDLDAGLRRLGYPSFRPGQRQAIERLLEHGRLLLVAPTGGGKSLIYQLPASLLPGTTLVVSPLISLMQDQVRALSERGVPATFFASILDAAEMRGRMARLAAGAFRLAYVAPERLVYPGFRGLLQAIACSLLAVDEAHCISEWGHDFRPEYLALGALREALPGARVLACTATATPVVRDEILARLGLEADTPQIVHGFARPNLALRALEVQTSRERARRVDGVLAEVLGAPGERRGTAIVYSPTRKLADNEGLRLQARGWRAETYHAGLDGPRRQRVQQAFADGAIEIVVATNAFGMGIDRPDVRAVVHLAPPGSIEAYYQEVGRAGRDGQDAVGLLLVGPGDMALRRRLLEHGGDGATPAPEVVEHKWGLFLELMRWIEGGSCRHDAILRYFGDEAETLDGCGRCDECGALASGAHARDPDDVTVIVRKALSGVARVNGRFGLQVAVKLLHGTPDPRLERSGLSRMRTFGTLRAHPEPWLTRLLRRCVTAGWVTFDGGDRPVVRLTEDGRAVMRDERPARLLLPSGETPSRRDPTGAVGPAEAPLREAREPEAPPGARAQVAFEALRRHRLTVAHDEGVPPFVVASDRTLRELARMMPRTLDELKRAYGIGRHKAERYGAGFLGVVAQILEAPPPSARPETAGSPSPEPAR